MLKKGDVVLVREHNSSNCVVGKLLLLCSVEGVSIAVLEQWTLKVENLVAGFSKWSPEEAPHVLVPLEDIADTLIHTTISGNKTVTVLHSPDRRD